jgi:hypothetical protein
VFGGKLSAVEADWWLSCLEVLAFLNVYFIDGAVKTTGRVASLLAITCTPVFLFSSLTLAKAGLCPRLGRLCC